MKEKKVNFWFAGFFCLAVLIWLLPGCARPEEVSLAPLSDTEDGATENGKPILTDGEVNAVGSVFPVSFEGIVAAEDLTRFIAGVDYADGTHNNEAQETGLILSPCFTMTAGGAAVPCHAARTAGAFGIRSRAVSKRRRPAGAPRRCSTDSGSVIPGLR